MVVVRRGAFLYNSPMRSIFATIILGTALLGCTANKEIEKFADRACACADKDCATKVADEFAVWMKDNKNARGDEEKAAKDGERFAKCVLEKGGDLTKFMAAAQEAAK
jgi:hypothetical protein